MRARLRVQSWFATARLGRKRARWQMGRSPAKDFQTEASLANLSLYERLDVSHNATTAEIKKAFRQRSLQLHPDAVAGAFAGQGGGDADEDNDARSVTSIALNLFASPERLTNNAPTEPGLSARRKRTSSSSRKRTRRCRARLREGGTTGSSLAAAPSRRPRRRLLSPRPVPRRRRATSDTSTLREVTGKHTRPRRRRRHSTAAERGESAAERLARLPRSEERTTTFRTRWRRFSATSLPSPAAAPRIRTSPLWKRSSSPPSTSLTRAQGSERKAGSAGSRRSTLTRCTRRWKQAHGPLPLLFLQKQQQQRQQQQQQQQHPTQTTPRLSLTALSSRSMSSSTSSSMSSMSRSWRPRRTRGCDARLGASCTLGQRRSSSRSVVGLLSSLLHL